MLYHSVMNSRAQYGIIAWGRAASCNLQPISVVSNRAMKFFKTNELLPSKVITIHKTQKNSPTKRYINLEVSKLMYKYTKSHLPAAFNNYFKLITDVHPYDTRQIKTRRFALPKTHSNSGAKMIKYSATEIWSRIPLDIKSKTRLAVFEQNITNMHYSATSNTFCVLYIGVHKQGA